MCSAPAAAILGLIGLYIAFFAAPTDFQQGDAYRIIFIHVPAAWMSMFIYLVMAFLVMRWNRGVLPLAAALAIVLLIFAAVSAPAWFDRDATGYTNPALPSDLLGLISALLVPVQVLLIFVAMSGFRQAWNVEIERHQEPPPDRHEQRGPTPAPA